MVDGASSAIPALSGEELNVLGKEVIDNVLGSHNYQHNSVNQWSQTVVDKLLHQLTQLNKPYKYIVTCVIMQKNGAGLTVATSCYWDNTTDHTHMIRWENKTMNCVVTVFNVAI